MGNSGVATPPEYLYPQLLQDLALMFAKNGYSVSSFNLFSDFANTSQMLGNMLILEELQYDKGTLNVQSLALYR